MSNNPSFRYPFEGAISKLPPEHQEPLRALFNGLTDLYSANAINTAKVQSLTPTASTSASTSTVTTQQVKTIASTQAQAAISMTFGKVNPQTSSYTTVLSDYGGIIQINDASANVLTLDGTTLPNQWFAFIENIGAGTATVTPATGTINGVASITLVTNQSAVVFFDSVNWAAATSVSGSGLPVNDPTFTGTITGPHYAGNGSIGSILPGPGAGPGSSIAITTANDARGVFELTIGSTPTAGSVVDITFAVAYASTPAILITPLDSNTVGAGPFVLPYSATGFSISFNTPGSPTAGAMYNFSYFVMG